MYPCDEVSTRQTNPTTIPTTAAHLARLLDADATPQPEKDRMDIYHQFFAVARRGQLHQAPVPSEPHLQPRILDVGCGTGIWAIDMAE